MDYTNMDNFITYKVDEQNWTNIDKVVWQSQICHIIKKKKSLGVVNGLAWLGLMNFDRSMCRAELER